MIQGKQNASFTSDPFSDEKKDMREKSIETVNSLIDMRRERIRTMHRLSQIEIKENSETIKSTINEFDYIR